MNQDFQRPGDSRRDFIKKAATGTVAVALAGSLTTPATSRGAPAGPAQTVRDKLWLFGVPAGANNQRWGLPRPSRMTPVEGAFYLGVPNLFMITVEGHPPQPYDQYAIPFRAMKRFAWALVGSGGRTGEEDRKRVLELPKKFPNMVGFFMDDFFHRDGSGALGAEQLKGLRRQMVVEGRRLDLYVVLYTHQLDLPVGPLLEYCDKITLWTWKHQDLAGLDRDFRRLEQLAPKHGKLLGLYMWDFGNKGPMPVRWMKHQCELGLKWLREGRVEGLVFLANSVADLDLEAVEWSRRWIAEVGDQELAPTRK